LTTNIFFNLCTAGCQSTVPTKLRAIFYLPDQLWAPKMCLDVIPDAPVTVGASVHGTVACINAADACSVQTDT